MTTISKPDNIEKRIREAGERAKAEADKRRALEPQRKAAEPEIGGPKGPEPTRYGDWERKGIVSDF
ncbi:MAG TPA: succinate dehydrogenase assembly factor 4 [Rhizomicrobium sp.]